VGHGSRVWPRRYCRQYGQGRPSFGPCVSMTDHTVPSRKSAQFPEKDRNYTKARNSRKETKSDQGKELNHRRLLYLPNLNGR
jgi:hypothetical protein